MTLLATLAAGATAVPTRLNPVQLFLDADIVVQVATDAIQVLGGYGYMKEYPVENAFVFSTIPVICEKSISIPIIPTDSPSTYSGTT